MKTARLEHGRTDRGKVGQYSLRSVILLTTIISMALSGAFTNPVTILLASMGLIFFWTGLKNRGEILMLGIVAGVGWIAMAALIDYLLRMPIAS